MKYILIIFVFLLSACSGVQAIIDTPTPTVTPTLTVTPSPVPTITPTPIPCSQQMSSYFKEMEPVLRKWSDTYQTATSTARIALSPIILQLQESRRQAEDIKPAPCSPDIHTNAILAMEASIDGFTAFMGKQSDATVNGYFEKVSNYIGLVNDELAKFRNQEPPYDD